MSQFEEHCCCQNGTRRNDTYQTLDEMDFERGIWSAAQYGELDRIQKLLVKTGIQVDQKDSYGYTALQFAARHGRLNVCEYLVSQGADVNTVTRSCNSTPLHRACSAGHVEVVEYLLSKKADPSVCDVDGKTALHRAAENKHKLICELIERKASYLKDVPDNKGRLPCDYYE